MKTTTSKRKTIEQQIRELAIEKGIFSTASLMPFFPNNPKGSIEKNIIKLHQAGYIAKTKTRVKGLHGKLETLFTTLEA